MEVNTNLLASIKEFMDDLTSVVKDNENFDMFYSIVKKIDNSKVKPYNKLIDGFSKFFKLNETMLKNNEFAGLIEPCICYVSEHACIFFNFEEIFKNLPEEEQDVVKLHLNQIFNNLTCAAIPEKEYLNKIICDLGEQFSSSEKVPSDQMMMIFKKQFEDFQKQNLDISVMVKLACQKAKENVTDPNSPLLILANSVENIDINNISMTHILDLVSQMGILSNGTIPMLGL